MMNSNSAIDRSGREPSAVIRKRHGRIYHLAEPFNGTELVALCLFQEKVVLKPQDILLEILVVP
jgi:hypothetical protein